MGVNFTIHDGTGTGQEKKSMGRSGWESDAFFMYEFFQICFYKEQDGIKVILWDWDGTGIFLSAWDGAGAKIHSCVT